MATTVLVVALCAIYAGEWAWGPRVQFWLVEIFGLSWAGLMGGMVWQPVTHMFLHGNLLHLLVNAIGLFFVGRVIEAWLGSLRMLVIFFAGGVAGGLLQAAVNPVGSLIGASGGVCALVLAFCTLAPNLEITVLVFFVVPLRLRAKYLGWGILAVSVILPLLGWDESVGHWAHLGGALTGIAWAKWFQGAGFWRGGEEQRRIFGGGGQRVASGRGWRWADWRADKETRELDAILNKVARHGLGSLTAEERERIERWGRSSGAGR